MASVGGIGCTFVRPAPGEPEIPKATIDSWRRPGMAGEGNQYMGFAPARFRYTAVLYDTPANVEQWGRAIEAIVGQIVAIVDDFGTTYPAMLIKGATALKRETAYNASAPRHRGEIQLVGTRVT